MLTGVYGQDSAGVEILKTVIRKETIFLGNGLSVSI